MFKTFVSLLSGHASYNLYDEGAMCKQSHNALSKRWFKYDRD